MSATTTASGVRPAAGRRGRGTFAVTAWVCLVAAGLLLGAGCSTRPASGPAVSIQADAGWVTVRVEVADTDAERARGLMQRQTLPEDSGMVFVYSKPAEHLFWMENTLIPLDMIFIGPDDRVVGIESRAEPLSREVRGRGWISRAVLEVNGGWAAEHGVRVGDRVRFDRVSFPGPSPAR